jgi:hypothetical protein
MFKVEVYMLKGWPISHFSGTKRRKAHNGITRIDSSRHKLRSWTPDALEN